MRSLFMSGRSFINDDREAKNARARKRYRDKSENWQKRSNGFDCESAIEEFNANEIRRRQYLENAENIKQKNICIIEDAMEKVPRGLKEQRFFQHLVIADQYQNSRDAAYHYVRIHNKTSQYEPCVYVVRDDSTGMVKIGKTVRFPRRMRSLKTSNPGICLVARYIVETEKDAYTLEKLVHSDLSRYRRDGEWFELPDRFDVDEVFENCMVMSSVSMTDGYGFESDELPLFSGLDQLHDCWRCPYD